MNTKTLKSALIIVAIIAMLAAGCAPKGEQLPEGTVVGSGKVVNSTIEVSGISSVVFSAPGYLTISQGDAESLTIQGEDNIVPLIVAEVKDGVLTISLQDGALIKTNSMIQYTLVVKDLTAVENVDTGYVVTNGLTVKDFSYKAYNSGKAKLDGLTATNLTIETIGGGEIVISGTADTLTLINSGTGVFDGADLAVTDAVVTLSGSADSTVNATGKLDVTLSGSGNLLYVGTPTLTQNVTGTGTVSQAE